jgi:hypothetical protein
MKPLNVAKPVTHINMEIKTGAGVIPFASWHGSTWFLFHKTFSGRRAGLLVDFGGGSRSGESHVQAAAREFIEETDAMFFAENSNDKPGSVFRAQYQRMLQLIEQTQHEQPHWNCRRTRSSSGKPKNWKTFFVELAYRDPVEMNRAWAQDTCGRFRKRRELLWLTSGQLIDIIDNSPERLWKRVREYEGMRDVVLAIANSVTQGRREF